MNTDLHECPEVIQISAETGLDVFSVIGRLGRLWGWFDRHTVDGRVSQKFVTHVTLDSFACHTGFAKAVENANWLSVENGVMILPHFERHNGETAKKRFQDADRQRKRRTKKTSRCHVTNVTAKRDQRREEKNIVLADARTGGECEFDPVRLERIVRSYCTAANKRYSAEALKSAVMIVRSGEATLDELEERVDAINRQVELTPRSVLRFQPSPHEVFANDAWKSEPSAFRLGENPDGETVGMTTKLKVVR
jgi:hypothetical protein